MSKIKASVTKYISEEPWPGIVEVEVEGATGKVWKIIDKTAVVSSKVITAQSTFPIETYLECITLEKDDRTNTALISLKPWGLETVEGLSEITVNESSLSN